MRKPNLSPSPIGRPDKAKGPGVQRKRRGPKEAGPGGDQRNDLLPTLTIETRRLAELTAAERPMRRLDPKHVDEVARGIGAYGFCVPVPITTSGEVIDGHVRLAAARKQGLDRVPCIQISHLSATEIRTLRLALNRLQEKGTWDLDALKVEFEALIELEVDLSATGFEVPEIDLVLQGDASDPSEGLDAEANAVPAIDPERPPVSRRGDLLHLGPHRVRCGDAREPAAYQHLLAGQTARMLCTDPPYNLKMSDVGGRGQIQHREFPMASGEMSEAEFVAFLTEFLNAACSTLAAGSLTYLFMDWRHFGQLTAAAKTAGVLPINLCVWVKPNGGMGGLYRSRHELILVGKMPGRHQNNVQLGRFGRNRTNVWLYPGVNSLNSERRAELARHPTTKPVELIVDAILDASSPGDIVLDPFLGSGTTIIAAEKTRRVCAGIELDPLYVDTAVRRWEAFTGQAAIHAETGLSFAALAEKRNGAPNPTSTEPSPTPAPVAEQLTLFPDQEDPEP